MAEVAYRVGFDNKSHFVAQFRKAIGTTAKAYRDSFQREQDSDTDEQESSLNCRLACPNLKVIAMEHREQ